MAPHHDEFAILRWHIDGWDTYRYLDGARLAGKRMSYRRQRARQSWRSPVLFPRPRRSGWLRAMKIGKRVGRPPRRRRSRSVQEGAAVT
jgi:hypothetical protein